MTPLDYGPVITLAIDSDISSAELLVVLRDHIRDRDDFRKCHEDSIFGPGGYRAEVERPTGARVLPGGLVDQMAQRWLAESDRKRWCEKWARIIVLVPIGTWVACAAIINLYRFIFQ